MMSIIGWRQNFLLLIAATILNVACASPAAPPARAQPTTVRETGAATQETDQWQSYPSREYGFEFRYPQACPITELNGSIYVGGRIELTILESDRLGLNEYVTRFVDSRTKDGSWMVESIKGSSLGGREVMTVDYRFGGQRRFGTATFAIREAKVFVWDLTAGGFTCDETDAYGPILASFRFTN